MIRKQACKRNNYHYNKALKNLAKYNRQHMTKSAACMWKYVLGQKQMLGYQFTRERPILNYIVDFACLELLLIIEVDGITHESESALFRDKERDQLLSSIGFTVLRFGSWEVLNRIHDVSSIIIKYIEEQNFNKKLKAHSTPYPPQGGNEFCKKEFKYTTFTNRKS